MSKSKDALDVELLDIINRLNKIQEEVGGGETKKKEEKKGKIDKFIDVQKGIEERLEGLREKIEMSKGGGNAREMIELKSEIRNDLQVLNDDWNELNTLYMNEARKKRSKITPEELQNRQNILVALQESIADIKDMQRAGFVPGYAAQRLVRMEDSEAFKPRTPGDESKYDVKNMIARNSNITGQQQMALMRIKERDKMIDDEIDQIGVGVDELGQIARMARDEVKLQSTMLDTLEEKMDNVHEKVLTLNEKMKATLEEVRQSDKICVDIFCLLVSVGLIIVLIKLTTNKK